MPQTFRTPKITGRSPIEPRPSNAMQNLAKEEAIRQLELNLQRATYEAAPASLKTMEKLTPAPGKKEFK